MREKLSEYPEFVKAVTTVINAENSTPRSEMKLTINGQDRVVGYSGTAVKDVDGERLGSTLLFQDITNLSKPK